MWKKIGNWYTKLKPNLKFFQSVLSSILSYVKLMNKYILYMKGISGWTYLFKNNFWKITQDILVRQIQLSLKEYFVCHNLKYQFKCTFCFISNHQLYLKYFSNVLWLFSIDSEFIKRPDILCCYFCWSLSITTEPNTIGYLL